MGCPAHAEVALSVARELGCSLEGTDLALAELAASLAPGDAYSELQAVGVLCETFGHGPALLLPDVLRARAGDSAGVALAVAAAAQRAGLSVDLVAPQNPGSVPSTMRFRSEQGFSYEHEVEGTDPLYLAHPDAPLVVEASGRLLDGRTLGVDLEWQCAHETTATILDRIAERAERTGDLALAIAARALTLPLEGDYREREHARLLARLN
ncbi:hypothetical protein [Solirubrobacter soli]|uniref:hypothetical protein n=1 Tax=Solirubrobacter soli TaxID=363832 RepID=UPI000423F3F8|nr:hypothetical protein [Solirubrobacter soli]